MFYAMQNCVLEWSYCSSRKYGNPFRDIELSVEMTDPEGVKTLIPAFWHGGETWTVRYSSPKIGRHTFRTLCSDNTNTGLHDKEGIIEITGYEGNNPLLKHGPIRVSEDRRHLEHRDGTPFFWLGDTWWMGLTTRLPWPEEFKQLAADRVRKGFSVIQIIAGLYPDMVPFDERGANEAGFPWDKEYTSINPSYFDMADQKIQWLVKCGLLPCIVGCWGFFLDFAGMDVLKQHWRYIIARYGAYPAVWCAAGEALMPFYGSVDWAEEKNARYRALGTDEEKRQTYMEWARNGWSEITEYIRATDSGRHPVTIHPTDFGHKMVQDPSILDINMLQTGHGDWQSMVPTVDMVEEALKAQPVLPVIDGEVCYEGIGGMCGPDVQRFAFWTAVLTGAAGHTYGANGIWQLNTPDKPYGVSPHGLSWGHTSWKEAMNLPGSQHLGLGKCLLERYPWWKFQSHPEWVEPHADRDNRRSVYAAGIPGEVKLFYLPANFAFGPRFTVRDIEKNVKYRAYLYDPTTGDEYDYGDVAAAEDGTWKMACTFLPVYIDFVLVLERTVGS